MTRNLSLFTKNALISSVMVTFFQGCYTIQQGYYQAKLILRRQNIDEILKTSSEKPERLQKLKLVPKVLEFARNEIQLTPGNSYKTYVALDGPSLSYVVQAAEKRAFKLKTWWFPLVGSQPYLGFFEVEKAKKLRDELVIQGFDTSMGGVQAFSLLGYFPDPVYSSMLDGNEIEDFVEVLFHESLHSTLYIPDHSAFNENLADFVAKKATALFLRKNKILTIDIGAYESRYSKTIIAQQLFKKFLKTAKEELEIFYKNASIRPEFQSDEFFLLERTKIFDNLAQRYDNEVRKQVEGTNYIYAFRKGQINNATFLGYSLYESKQEPFELLLARCQQSLPKFLEKLKICLNEKSSSEEILWKKVEECSL